MNVQLNTISKINSLPLNLQIEVNDFVDFLLNKHKIALMVKNSELNLTESGMDTYLRELNEYENMLAEGKIKTTVE